MQKILLLCVAVLNLSCSSFFDAFGKPIGGDALERKSPKLSGCSTKELVTALENQNLDPTAKLAVIRKLSKQDDDELNSLSDSQKIIVGSALIDELIPLSAVSKAADEIGDDTDDETKVLKAIVSAIRQARDSAVSLLANKLLTEDFVCTSEPLCVNLIAIAVLVDGMADAPSETLTVEHITDALSGIHDENFAEILQLNAEFWDLSGAHPKIKSGKTRFDCKSDADMVAETVIAAASPDADDEAKEKMKIALSALLLSDGISGMSPFYVLGMLAP